MRRPTSIVVVAMACGAGLLATVQYVQARATRLSAPNQADTVRESDNPAPEAIQIVAPRAAEPSANANLAILATRLGSIEQKLEALGGAAEGARGEAAHAEDAVIVAPTAQDRNVEQQKAFDIAASVIESSLRSGLWVDADQKTMQEIKYQMLPGDQFAMKMKLTVAANQSKLRDLAVRPFFF